ncbi:hypothetical protein D3C71_2087430 [compost metagenome]
MLPFLHRERLAARLDLRAERGQGCLAVHAVHVETPGLDEQGLAALAFNLRALAGWLELPQVKLNCASGNAARLRTHLD